MQGLRLDADLQSIRFNKTALDQTQGKYIAIAEVGFAFPPVQGNFDPNLIANADRRIKLYDDGTYVYLTDESYCLLKWIVQT